MDIRQAITGNSLAVENESGTLLVFTPPSGRVLVIRVFFFFFCRVQFFFWWSPALDLQFSLGQTETRSVFRYTG